MDEINVISLYEGIIDGLVENNYAVIDHFSDEATLVGLRLVLLEKIKAEALQNAQVGNKTTANENQKVRTDQIQWIDNQSVNAFESSYFQHITSLCTYLNRTCYTGISDHEFHYAHYAKGAFYKRHLDRFKNDSLRKYSMITYLNQNWQEADSGVLVLYIGGQEIKISPEWGRTVIFKSDLIEHEVLESFSQRLSITGWLK